MMRGFVFIRQKVGFSLFPLNADHTAKTSHNYYFQVQLQIEIHDVGSADFLLFISENPGESTLRSSKE